MTACRPANTLATNAIGRSAADWGRSCASAPEDVLVRHDSQPEHNHGVLEEALDELAAHLRSFGEPRLADAVDRARIGEPERLPQRAWALFRHGMGGLLDVPLYRGGVLDREATGRRDELAEAVFAAAKAQLGADPPLRALEQLDFTGEWTSQTWAP